jgi:hypothetical protein
LRHAAQVGRQGARRRQEQKGAVRREATSIDRSIAGLTRLLASQDKAFDSDDDE